LTSSIFLDFLFQLCISRLTRYTWYGWHQDDAVQTILHVAFSIMSHQHMSTFCFMMNLTSNISIEKKRKDISKISMMQFFLRYLLYCKNLLTNDKSISSRQWRICKFIFVRTKKLYMSLIKLLSNDILLLILFLINNKILEKKTSERVLFCLIYKCTCNSFYCN